ncbi:MAG TPA: hypothetical protein PLB05_00155 [Candidatus Omnitrophota bacterium]|jgi:hypothetical protein|nr:hypothetical protein [Candidatus Omnitrophota bacterium]HPN57001.1 hypothetical protein [Candidatus Omnitrophota bacterium]
MKHTTMDRKTFLKWLSALLVGLCSNGGLGNASAAPSAAKRPLKEARHYRPGRHLAG